MPRRRSPLSLLLLATIACAPIPDAGSPPAPQEPAAVAARIGAAAAPDGVPIAYDVRGAGDTALVFIHCWACDRSFWREQVDVFAADYRVVTLDLAGHGESGRERDGWSIVGLAGDVESVVGALDLERVILIGHSMGGPVALETARRMPERVVGVACVDTLHDLSMRFPEEVMERMVGAFRADFEATMASMVGQMFPEGSEPSVRDWVVERANRVDRQAAIALMADFADLDLAAIAADVEAPVRCVNATPIGVRGLSTDVEGNREHLDFDVRLMEGVGHYLQLERPAELNDELRWALAEIERP